MAFTHDTDAALGAAVVLANSMLEPDTLTTVDELTAFLDEWEYTGRHDATAAELEEVRAVRPDLRRLLLAGRDEAVGLVNEMLADNHALPRLVRHGRHDWHITRPRTRAVSAPCTSGRRRRRYSAPTFSTEAVCCSHPTAYLTRQWPTGR